MRDDRAMGEEDFAVLEDVAYELFGDAVDPRELSDVISKMGDASEMHVNRDLNAPLTLKEKRKRKTQAQIGLASNIVGMGAGGAAVVAAARNPALKNQVTSRFSGFHNEGEGGPVTSRVGRYIKTPAGRARLYRAGAAGALALQVGNTAGDVVSNIVLQREAKKKLPTDISYRRKKIKKSMDEIVNARRQGLITTEKAIEMASEVVEKVNAAMGPMAANFEKEAEKIVPFTSHAAKTEGLKQPKKSMALRPAMPKMKPKAFKAPNSPDDIKTSFGKSESPELVWEGEISKMDTDKRQVFGFCTVTHVNGEPVVDLQGDYVPLEEIEKAAYSYVVDSRKGGDMHERDGEQPLHTSDMIESVIITPEKLKQWGLAEDAMPYGWWVGFKVNDDAQWEKVRKNERTGFSIHGSGKRVEKVL
jgi:Putative phage serine protease XkdF